MRYNFTQRDRGSLYGGESYVASFFGNRKAFLWAKASPLFDRDGTPVGAIESIRDITERKIKEQALEESEERYRTLTENVADGVALIQKRKLLFVNNAFVTIFGYTKPADIVGWKAVDLFRSDYHNDFKWVTVERKNSYRSIAEQFRNIYWKANFSDTKRGLLPVHTLISMGIWILLTRAVSFLTKSANVA